MSCNTSVYIDIAMLAYEEVQNITLADGDPSFTYSLIDHGEMRGQTFQLSLRDKRLFIIE